MNIPESCAIEALKAAMPFAEAEKLAASCAWRAVQELDSFNQKYTADNPWLDDGTFLQFPPMDNSEIERAALMLSKYYLILWHRRGLIGS
jgi:hypothetical protein